MKDIVKYKKYSKLKAFADDTMIYIMREDINTMVALMNEDLKTLNYWIGTNQMIVN